MASSTAAVLTRVIDGREHDQRGDDRDREVGLPLGDVGDVEADVAAVQLADRDGGLLRTAPAAPRSRTVSSHTPAPTRATRMAARAEGPSSPLRSGSSATASSRKPTVTIDAASCRKRAIGSAQAVPEPAHGSPPAGFCSTPCPKTSAADERQQPGRGGHQQQPRNGRAGQARPDGDGSGCVSAPEGASTVVTLPWCPRSRASVIRCSAAPAARPAAQEDQREPRRRRPAPRRRR